jgi:DNA-binding transcriptional LysR family regulator
MFYIVSIHVVNLSVVDLNLLVALDALLVEKSVTRAARRVGLSQPAMSNALARLRALFADPILVRAAKGMVPTPRADGLAAPIREALSTVERALAPPAFDPRTAHRTFTIATVDTNEVELVPKLIARLATEAPAVDVRVIPPARGANPTALLESETADIAVMAVKPVGPPLRAEAWYRERFVCIARKGHPALRGRLTLPRFCALAHVLIAPYGNPGSYVDDALARLGRRRRVAARLSSFLSAPVLVAESDLIATVGSRLARRAAAWLPLQILDLPLRLPEVEIGAIWHPRVEHDAGHRWFRELLGAIAKG